MAERIFAFNDQDLETIKSLFADNDATVRAIRNHYLLFPKSSEDAAILNMLTPKQKDFLSRLFLPIASSDNPIGRISDAWGTINTELGLGAVPFIKARHRTLKYLKERNDSLFGNGESTLTLDVVEADDMESFVMVETRRVVFHLIDQQLRTCVALAGKKEESVEETKERLLKDSSK